MPSLLFSPLPFLITPMFHPHLSFSTSPTLYPHTNPHLSSPLILSIHLSSLTLIFSLLPFHYTSTFSFPLSLSFTFTLSFILSFSFSISVACVT